MMVELFNTIQLTVIKINVFGVNENVTGLFSGEGLDGERTRRKDGDRVGTRRRKPCTHRMSYGPCRFRILLLALFVFAW